MQDDDADSSSTERALIVGGPVDELRVSLVLYGNDLDPDEVTTILGCAPTAAHRRGDVRVGAKTGKKTIRRQGMWLLSTEGTPPQTADDLTAAILDRIRLNEELWNGLAERFDIQMRYGVLQNAWNRELGLEGELVRKLALIRASLVFDIYAFVENDTAEGDER